MSMIEDRRALHRIPELDRQLTKTLSYVQSRLEGLGCEIISPVEGMLCAFFDFGKEKTIAFRSDADALPITERNSVEYASCHPGKMHACGHDGHMAIALELARRISKKKHLQRNVLIVFQGAEETTGGAKDLCDSGVFEKYHTEVIFGLHIWPGLPENQVFSRALEMMSRSCEVHVTVRGKSAHIAKAYEGIDAMAGAVEFYRRAVELERGLPPEVFRVLGFGFFHGGTACNAVAGEARLSGSLRAFQDEIFEGLREGLRQIGQEVSRELGCAVELSFGDGYPAVMNPPALYNKVKALVDFQELEKPSMTTEDFSWYQRYLPGMFFFLGAGDGPALHSDRFDFPEEILQTGADFFEHLAEEWK